MSNSAQSIRDAAQVRLKDIVAKRKSAIEEQILADETSASSMNDGDEKSMLRRRIEHDKARRDSLLSSAAKCVEARDAAQEQRNLKNDKERAIGQQTLEATNAKVQEQEKAKDQAKKTKEQEQAARQKAVGEATQGGEIRKFATSSRQDLLPGYLAELQRLKQLATKGP